MKNIVLIMAFIGGLVFYWHDAQDKNLQAFIAVIALSSYITIASLESIFQKTRPKYRCVFRKWISKNEDPRACLTQSSDRIYLPFPPYIGLSIVNAEPPDYQEFQSGKITKVVWDNFSGLFQCEVAPHEMTSNSILGAVIAHNQKYGWEIEAFDIEAQKALEQWKAQMVAEEQKPHNQGAA